VKSITQMMKSKSGLNMEKSKRSRDLNEKQRQQIVVEEINRFNSLVKGHRKILEAIGSL